jgi:flavin reductase (DIM6/NTAB) family NADH-FMN oxidoreductase RutF
MTSFLPSELDNRNLYGFFTSAIIPRPIALVSTIDQAGRPNLSPFSYFNVVSTRPPILMIAPVRNARNGLQKDTYENIREVPECVIHLVHFPLAEAMNQTSEAFPRGVNEFEIAGLEAIPSDLVKPPRVKASPVAFECKLNQIIELGASGGAGSLILMEILKIHVDEAVLNAQGRIDAAKLDIVARLGGNQYIRVQQDMIFEMKKPE